MDTSRISYLLITYQWLLLATALSCVTLFCISRNGYFARNYGGILYFWTLLELFVYDDSNAFRYIFATNFGIFVIWSGTYTRVIERVSGWEATYWSYVGDRGDLELQASLSSRLKAQQRANRRAKYQRQNEAVGEGTEERDAQFFARLDARCDRASAWEFEGPPYRPGETVEGVSREIDFNKRCGREIFRWLVREIKESEGFVVPVKWSKDKKTGGINCHNGYTNKSIPEDFFANSDDLVIGSVSVLRPDDIRPALRLINTALDYIEFYKTTGFVSSSGSRLASHRQFRRAVAVKCEFKRYPAEFERGSARTLDVDDLNWKETPGLNESPGVQSKYVEKDRELVSLLTVSVDRYLVVTFHLGYMLQHPTNATCTELNRLFHDLILNRRKIKIWHNLPDSIGALDATMEHIFRGHRPVGDDVREHARYRASLRKPFRETPDDHFRTPFYKDTGPDDLLQVNRPWDTEFDRSDRPCPLNLHGPGVDYAGRSCPCDKGILDITSLADYVLYQHYITRVPEIVDGTGIVTHPKPPWAEPTKNYSFSDLARWFLAGSKYQPLLRRFKTRSHEEPLKPNVEGLRGAVAKEVMNIYNMKLAIFMGMKAQLYTTSGETKGIEKDDTCLAYVTGDAIGLALIFRNFLTSESPSLMAERLSHYAYQNPYEVGSFAYETALFRKPIEPIHLPSYEQPNFYTLGLEVDIPPAVPSDTYIDIYERLAGRPEWWMRKDTFYKTGNDIAFSSVIATSIIHTGWEYPRMAIARRRDRILPPVHEDPADISAPEGNRRQPLGVRNLAARILRNNLCNIPEEFSRVLNMDVTTLNNGVWFAALESLLLWHCGLQSLGLPEAEMAIILNLSAAEETFREGFGEQVRATDGRPVAARAAGEDVPPLLAGGTPVTVPVTGTAATTGAVPVVAQPAVVPPLPVGGVNITAANQVEKHGFADGICAEILIYMLVKEISTFEELDTARKLVLGLDKMARDYNVSTGVSIYDSLPVRHIMAECKIDDFSYQEPYWFKRLQVLLGHEFVQGVPLNSPHSKICYECGARDRAELVEMLVGELKRFLHLSRLQEGLKPVLRKICQDGYRHRWVRNLIPNPKRRPNLTVDRREPTHRVDKRRMWPQLPVEGDPAAVEPMTEAEGLRAAQQKVTEWTIPRWYECLIGDQPDIVTATLTPLTPPPSPRVEFPKPTVARVHNDWLEAVIVLLHLNPETGPDSWNCIRKMWNQGLYMQGLKLADENVQHSNLPSLELVRTPGSTIRNYGIDQGSINQRRRHNVRIRARIHQGLVADTMLCRRVRERPPPNPRVNRAPERPEPERPPRRLRRATTSGPTVLGPPIWTTPTTTTQPIRPATTTTAPIITGTNTTTVPAVPIITTTAPTPNPTIITTPPQDPPPNTNPVNPVGVELGEQEELD